MGRAQDQLRGTDIHSIYHRDLVFLPLPVASSIKVPWFVFEVWASVEGSLSGGWGYSVRIYKS